MYKKFISRKYISRKIISAAAICSVSFLLAACGPSDEKVEAARQKYSELAQVNDQIVEAHKQIADDSLDELIIELQEKSTEIGRYNLAEMKDEEIDALIETMDELIRSYEEYQEMLLDIKKKEEAAVLTSISVAVANDTDFSFSVLRLYEKGDYDDHVNVLEDMETFAPGQTLTGLVIRRDVNNTPWILVLEEEGGTVYELELPAGEYEEEGVSLSLTYDEEGSRLIAE